MKVFYHDDPDGLVSAAVVHKYYQFPSVSYTAVDYSMDFDFNDIRSGELVYVLDFSFNSDQWNELLLRTQNVVWIDHHESAIMKYTHLSGLPGIRDTHVAGCILTWKYLFPDTPIPKCVLYVGDYDVWAHEFAPESTYLHEAILAKDELPTSVFWDDALAGVRVCNSLIEEGKAIVQYQKAVSKRHTRNVFITDVNGLKFCCLNTTIKGSRQFDSVGKDFDVLCVFHLNSKQLIDVSFYSTNKSIRCDKIAERLGGGGHPQAAGAANVSTSEFFQFLNIPC